MDDQPNITKNSRLQLEVFVRPGREVNVDVACMIDGYCFDLIAWGWGVFYKDHGKWSCEECRQNDQGFKPFDKVEDLYADHFSDALNVMKNYHAGDKMWVYSEPGTAVETCSHRNTDRKEGKGWHMVEIESINLDPLEDVRKGRDKHARAIHKMLSEAIEAIHV